MANKKKQEEVKETTRRSLFKRERKAVPERFLRASQERKNLNK